MDCICLLHLRQPDTWQLEESNQASESLLVSCRINRTVVGGSKMVVGRDRLLSCSWSRVSSHGKWLSSCRWGRRLEHTPPQAWNPLAGAAQEALDLKLGLLMSISLPRSSARLHRQSFSDPFKCCKRYCLAPGLAREAANFKIQDRDLALLK